MTTKKGQKRLKNIPILHDEVKTKRTVVLTPTAWENTIQYNTIYNTIQFNNTIQQYNTIQYNIIK